MVIFNAGFHRVSVNQCAYHRGNRQFVERRKSNFLQFTFMHFITFWFVLFSAQIWSCSLLRLKWIMLSKFSSIYLACLEK